MIWYILAFVIGVAIGATGMWFVTPRIVRLWDRMNVYATHVKRVKW